MECCQRSFVLILLLLAFPAFAQGPGPRARITGPVDNRQTVTLHGSVHRLARAEFDQGPAPDDLPARRMMLQLARSPEQDAALEALLREQQTPGSANYHRWLTPGEFGGSFGVAPADVQAVSTWLQQQGFTVDRVAKNNALIQFSGTAGLVRQAFHASIHRYQIEGRSYWANAGEASIPAALAPVVQSVVSLSNFPSSHSMHKTGVFHRDPWGVVSPALTASSNGTTYYAVGPGDFSVIYNTGPLLSNGTSGSNQAIAIIGRTNINLQDISDFRTLFQLNSYGGQASVVLDGPDPGIVPGDEDESVLDVEWAGAVAPGAHVMLVSAEDTETSYALDLAALHAIDNNLAGVVSLSYSDCEPGLPAARRQFYSLLWEQAAAQGTTVVVATGDGGSAGCDDFNTAPVATSGLAVNGLGSTAYNVAVGGTDFDDAGTQATYWSGANNSNTLASALGYVPERTWNNNCAASATSANLNVCPLASSQPTATVNIIAASGGASQVVAKPAWQAGPGVPADGHRDVPDVALFSAAGSSSNSFYVVCQADQLQGNPSCQRSSSGTYFLSGGGTSFATPAFAGLVALAEQSAGTRLGNVNYLLYSLAAGSGASCPSSASSSSSCVFHDVIKGNNSVPCQAGSPNCSVTAGNLTGVLVTSSGAPAYQAGAGYDLATGLGSLNAASFAAAVANAINNAAKPAVTLKLNGDSKPITANHGDSISINAAVANPASSGGAAPPNPTGDVALIGSTGNIGFGTLSGGVAQWSSTIFPGGTYTVSAHYPGDGTHAAGDSNGIQVTISPESSKILGNLVSFNPNSGLPTYNVSSVPYGSPYILRADVTDSAGTLSSSQGPTSKCLTGAASCPTGTLTITANGNNLDGGSFPLNIQGYTEDLPIQLPGGTWNVNISYPGDASYNASSVSPVITITPAATSSTATPTTLQVQYGTASNISVQVATQSSGVAPTGSISFLDNGATETPSSFRANFQNGGATAATSTFTAAYVPQSVGTHLVVPQYSGDGNYAGSSATALSFTASKATLNPQSPTLSSTVTVPAVPITMGVVAFSGSQLAAPTGTMQFLDNGAALSGSITANAFPGSPNGGEAEIAAQMTVTFTQPGSHAITFSYAGDGNYNPLNVNVGTVTVNAKFATTVNAVQSSLSPALNGIPVTLSAFISGQAAPGTPSITGTVTFSDNGQQLTGTPTYQTSGSNLTAALPYTFTSSGSHSITASYSGDNTYAATTSAQALSLSVVDKLPTSVAFLNASTNPIVAGQPTTLSARIVGTDNGTAPVMGGPVTLLDGSTAIPGTATITNAANDIDISIPYTFATTGAHSITVQYGGDAHFAAVSSIFTEQVAGELSLTTSIGSNPSITEGAAGGSIPETVFVANNTNAPVPVTLTCTPDSTAATCSIQANFSSFNASAGTTPVSLTFAVPANLGALRNRNPFGVPLVFAGVIFAVSLNRRRRVAALTLLALAFALTMVSCGSTGGGGSTVTVNPPAPKLYHFTVTATSGSNSDTQVFTVTVQ
ncbi:MAG: Ig-like domain repeat protein [Acidobacteria bacterium]|nr:Ig-like domain repeat protein [Acidobacteriota bacterium]